MTTFMMSHGLSIVGHALVVAAAWTLPRLRFWTVVAGLFLTNCYFSVNPFY